MPQLNPARHVCRNSGGRERMPMHRLGRCLTGLLALLLASCASLSPQQRNHAEHIAQAARSTQVDCTRSDACALASPVLQMAQATRAASTPQAPQHRALILDDAPNALLLRVHLIRSAQHSIDLQTYIFDEDDAAQLILDELQAAAFRGVKVRILVDQLAALRRVETFAALASLHANLELRVYNPVLDRARLSLPMYAVAAVCCWRQLNQRMHNKLLVVDDTLGITGGRNYQNDYYDWGEDYNFRDRDVMVAGPVVHDMTTNFDAFWQSPRSVPAAQLGDVARYLKHYGPPPAPHHPFHNPERVRALLASVDDSAALQAHFVAPAMPVQHVSFVADLPVKHRKDLLQTNADIPAGFASHIWCYPNPRNTCFAVCIGKPRRRACRFPPIVWPPPMPSSLMRCRTNTNAATCATSGFKSTSSNPSRRMRHLNWGKPVPACSWKMSLRTKWI